MVQALVVLPSVIELSWGVLLSCVILALSSCRLACGSCTALGVYYATSFQQIRCLMSCVGHTLSSGFVMCLVTFKVRCDVSIVNVSSQCVSSPSHGLPTPSVYTVILGGEGCDTFRMEILQRPLR